MNGKVRLVTVAVGVIITLGALVSPVPAQEPEALPLAEPGPYSVGLWTATFEDESRDNRELNTRIWYPSARLDEPQSYILPEYDAEPYMDDGPYPIIFFSHHRGGSVSDNLALGPHLASYGFVVAATDHNDPYPHWPTVVERPQDILFLLNQFAEHNATDYSGVIDTDHAGITGYSFGGYTTVAVAGAQVDLVAADHGLLSVALAAVGQLLALADHGDALDHLLDHALGERARARGHGLLDEG